MVSKWTYGPKMLHGHTNAPWLIEERPGIVLAGLWDEEYARLFTAAANAIRLAAERLGVDALALADILEDGAIADLVGAYQARGETGGLYSALQSMIALAQQGRAEDVQLLRR